MRWIVDAMNVIGARPDGWWRDRRGAMVRLVADLEQWACVHGHSVTVVFEGPTSPPIRSDVIVVANAPAPTADSADHEIVRQVRSDPRPDLITVVTSDRTLAASVSAAGATLRPAAVFRDMIDPVASRPCGSTDPAPPGRG